MKQLLPLLLIILFATCKTSPAKKAKNEVLKTEITPQSSDSKDISTIAFGSCNKTDLPQKLWQSILKNDPNLWIWLGDIVYADSNDPNDIKKEYDRQKANPEYQKLELIFPNKS